MKKFLLIIFIAVCAVFIYLKVGSLGDPDSRFNQTTRFKLGEYSALRTIFSLHNDGDARGWYLAGAGQIDIEVARAENVEMDEIALQNFVNQVGQYTGRPVQLFNAGAIKSGRLTAADLADINASRRHRVASGDTNLFVIYADDFARQSGEVGETYQETAVALSDKRLKEVTGGNPEAFSQYLQSTLLHEFGHQIGLEHNSRPNCIMNVKVEQPDRQAAFTGFYTPTQFCDFELKQLETVKAGF